MIKPALNSQDVLDALAQSPYRRVRNLAVEVAGESVSLHGRLGSYFEKQVAQEAVLRVSGVGAVHNHSTVDYA
ncbi:BON domain-containing protein [Lignipirellula cremea]|uniref:BON domain protein n=1 Tax=Lignipirellula cremea TaxID=2528010 RepID=A0A518DT55_9BACT|nr:BON domain-containing protein [Lignipirellula cremea]QDU95017.1 BON domain protein [Lignipirellula cremea]